MKTRKRFAIMLTGYLLLIAMMLSLSAVLPVSVYAADTRTPISEVEATVEMPVPTYGGTVNTSYAFTVNVGSPAKTADHMSGWYVYDEEADYWNRYSLGVFREGRYYYSVQIRIDQPYGSEYIFSPEATAKVNGEVWILESINSYATYSYAYLRSPDYVVEKSDIPLSFSTTYNHNVPISYKDVPIDVISVADCAIGGKEPYGFSKTSGPDWIQVSENGTIGGTPSTVGENANLVVRVTDAVGAYKEVTLTVQSTKPDPSKREAVSVFTITSDMPTPPAPGGECKHLYNFTFTEGGVAHLAPSMGYWQKHESNGWQRYNGTSFTEGLFRYMIQLRIDGANGELYKLADEITVKIDGKEWQHETIFVEPTYSCAYLISPEYTLEYEKITDITVTDMPKFTVGEVPNLSVSAISLPENAPYTVKSVGWFDESDDEWMGNNDTFNKDHLYFYSVTLAPKAGYSFAPMGELTANVDGQSAAVVRNGNDVQLRIAAGKPISYTVTFEAGGGTGNMEGLTVGGSYKLPECSFTAPDGKVFSHWSVTSLGPKAPGETIIMTEDITLTAEWRSCNVTFEANGGVGQLPAVSTAGSYKLPGCSFTPPRGYYFKAWAIGSPDGEQKLPSELITVSEDVRIFAVWAKSTVIDTVDLTGVTAPVANSTPVYDGITLNTAGVSINVLEWVKKSYGTVVSPTMTFEAGEEYYLNIRLTVAEGYALAPDAHNPNTFSIAVTSNLPYTKLEITSNGYIHMHYVVPIPYDVSFDANGGGGEMASLNDLTGTYELPECGFTSPVGHEFKCWSVNGEEKAVGNVITLDTDLSVKAIWRAKSYTISFNTDGGNAIDAITLEYGAAIVVPADPVKTGYTFDGWDTAIPSTMPAENITVTAKWTAVTSDTTTVADQTTTSPTDNTTSPTDNTTAPTDNTTAPTDNTTSPTDSTTDPDGETSTEAITSEKDDTDGNPSPAVWIAISVVSVVLIAGAVAALMFIKKKKGIE